MKSSKGILIHSCKEYQIGLEQSMSGSNFIFGCFRNALRDHKINQSRCGSYINSPGWLTKKKATIYPKNVDPICFDKDDNIKDLPLHKSVLLTSKNIEKQRFSCI